MIQLPQKAPTQGSPQSLLGRSEVHALEMKRDALKNQLEALTERRTLLGVQLHDARGTDAERALEKAIKDLDARTVRVNADLDKTDDAINRALDRDVAGQDAFPVVVGPKGPAIIAGPGESPVIQISPPFRADAISRELIRPFMLFEGFQIALLAVIAWRVLRSRGSASGARLAPEDAGRIDQLQRAVDVIAVEVERISEGQRFVNKALGGAEHGRNAQREAETAR